MTTYYVRKAGNDATGDGSTGNPWLTISKALSTVSTAGGHTIMVGDGTYQENTSALGYLLVQRAFSDWVTVQPELGALGAVTVSGTSSATYSLRFDISAKIRLKWLTITTATPLTSALGVVAYTGASGSYLELISCTLYVAGRVDGLAWAFIQEVSTAGRVFSNLLFDSCTIRSTGTGIGHGIRLDTTIAGASIDTVTIRDCDIEVTGNAVWIFDRVTNFLVDGGRYVSSGADMMAFQLGFNAQTGATVTGTVQDVYAWSALGHSILVGAGCSGVTVQDSWCDGGDQGLVVKQASNTILLRNYIAGGSLNALYLKAAVGATVSNNTIVNRTGNVVKVGYDSGNDDKCEDINFQNNIIIATSDGTIAMDWGDDTDDAGGGICDYNYYGLRGTNNSLSVRAGTGLTTIAAVQAAWSGYDVVGNDAHSGMTVYLSQADLSTLPTIAAFEARTLLAASYFDPATDTVTPLGGSIDSVSSTISANVVQMNGDTDPVDNLVLALGTGGLVEKLNSMLEAAGLAYRFTAEALAEAPSSGSGSGSTAYTNTVTDDSSNPLDGVEVWITSDSGGASTVASTTTSTLGSFTVYLDPGTYYLWLAKGGYNFPNPTTITVT